MAKDEEQRILSQINSLAHRLQNQRLHRLPDPEAQQRAIHKLETDLSDCWRRLRAERAGPSLWAR